jgi:hypothetical protein
MGLLDVRIEFDGERRTYAAGDVVSGRVVVRSEAAQDVRGIVVIRDWRARAGAVSETGHREEKKVSGPAKLRAGESYEFPFEFETPTSPFTYRGRLLTLDWRLTASVDAGERFVVESPFTVVPGEGAGKAPFAWEHNRERTQKARQYGHPSTPALVWFIGGLGLLFTIVGGLMAVTAVVGASSETVQQLVVGLILAGIGLLGAWQVFAASRARRTAESISLVVSTPVVRVNETLRLSLEVPARSGRISSARVFLICEEEAVQEGADGKKSTRRNVVRETEVASSAGPAAPGQPLRLQAVVRVPPNCPASFQGRCTSVNWLVEARLTLPFSPDFRTRTAFVLRP